MNARWDSGPLLQPITGERPCGDNLDDTELLSGFDTYRLFGQARPLDAPAEPVAKGMPTEKRIPKPAGSPEWVEIRDEALKALARSKDLRLLATLGTALLRTDGVPAFSETLNVASQWLETYWGQAYPLVDEDVIARRNALNCFADPMAVVEALRRTPLVSSRQHGTFSLRHIDIATGQVMPTDGDTRAEEKQIHAAFGAMPLEDLALLHDSVTSAVKSLRKIDETMSAAAGSEAVPDFGALQTQFGRMGQVLRAQLDLRPAGAPAASVEAAPDSGAGAGPVVPAGGVIRSRQDAIRVLDAVAEFFKRTEPSSPIPLFLARAKRLVSKDFLEVLEDIVPEAVAQARAAGGLKSEEKQE